MMFNDDFREDGDQRRKDDRPADSELPLSDKEVPFAGRVEIADAVHAWLDGVTPEREVRGAEWSRDIEFWKKLDDDLSLRRRMRTPAGLSARIMDSIPLQPAIVLPWWRREFSITATTAFMALMTTMAITALVTAAVIK